MNPIFTKYKYIKALEVRVAYLFFNFLRKWQEVHIESEAEACNVCSNHWGDEGNKEQHSPHRPDTEVFFLILGEAQVEKEKKEEEKEQALKSCRVLKKNFQFERIAHSCLYRLQQWVKEDGRYYRSDLEILNITSCYFCCVCGATSVSPGFPAPVTAVNVCRAGDRSRTTEDEGGPTLQMV